MNHKKFEIKDISAEGSFEGMLSPYRNVDGGGDIVEPGAYDKNLKEQGNTRVILWQHKTDVPIGQMTLEDRPDGLWCKGQLLMGLPEAQKAYLLIKSGIVKGLSIGYEAVKKSTKDGVRLLKELKLFEGSIVTFPMNAQALISSVKDAGTVDDFNEELSDIQLQDGGYQMFCALRSALSGLPGSGMSKDEILTATDAVLQQFADAFRAYMPLYLDMIAEDGYYGMQCMGLSRFDTKGTAPTKTVDGAELTADCFAYVGDPKKTETWKLPIKFPGDDAKTQSHIRNALARFGQTQGIPESEKPKVLAKIHAAAAAHGIDVAKGGKLLDVKEGRVISAANMDKLRTAHDHMKSAGDIVSALLENSAGSMPLDGAGIDTTDYSKAAKPTTQEPDELHSMVESFGEKLTAAIAA